MSKSSKEKATYKRHWRRQNYKEKQFNKIANEYLKIKYTNIYEELREFYNNLKQQNPTAKDLTKTKEFTRWKKQQEETATSSRVELNTYIIENPELQLDQITFSELHKETVQEYTVADSYEAAVQDLLAPTIDREPLMPNLT